MEAVKPVTDKTFAQDVLRSSRPVVVDFWADWCVPCRKVAVVLNELASSELAEKVAFAKVDIDANPVLTARFQVMSVPTITVFKNGEPVGSLAGARSKSELKRMIESAI